MSVNSLSGSQDVAAPLKVRRVDSPHHVAGAQAEKGPLLPTSPPLEGVGSPAWTTKLLLSGALEIESEGEPSDILASLTGELPVDRQEQREHEAEQLSAHLLDRAREIEYREAHLNARMAVLDNEARMARLWAQERQAAFAEKEQELADRAATIDRQERQLQGRHEQGESESNHRERALEQLQSALTQREAELTARERMLRETQPASSLDAEDLIQREAAIAAKEFQLRQRREHLEREAAAVSHAQQEWQIGRARAESQLIAERTRLKSELEAQMEERRQALESSEALLSEHAHELDQQRQDFQRERADWQRQKSSDREGAALWRRRAESELDQRRSRLLQREAALDKQQSALDQLRTEITTAHRQSLEMRLMAEQLWGQVQGRVPPAEVTQMIAQLRLKLSEQYGVEQQALAQQKEEILRIAEKIADQSATLKHQRQELQAWFKSRETEIERHAEALVSRERELDEQQERRFVNQLSYQPAGR